MALFLVRHGKNLSKDKDPDQGLSEQGIYEVNQMATIVKKSGIHISRIDHTCKNKSVSNGRDIRICLGTRRWAE